jgi:hypothetical protein
LANVILRSSATKNLVYGMEKVIYSKNEMVRSPQHVKFLHTVIPTLYPGFVEITFSGGTTLQVIAIARRR